MSTPDLCFETPSLPVRPAFLIDPIPRQELERLGRLLRRRVLFVVRRCAIRATPELLEDLVQDVFCHLFEDCARRLRSCRAESVDAADAYLGRIAERVALDRVRYWSASKRSRQSTVSYGLLEDPRLPLD